MNTKSKIDLLGMIAALSIVQDINRKDNLQHEPENKTSDEEKLIKYYQSKGLSKFTIEGKEIGARNYKNALKKFKSKIN